jgi:hypothetical protein
MASAEVRCTWGGVTNRFSAEDLTLKSRYGLAATGR